MVDWYEVVLAVYLFIGLVVGASTNTGEPYAADSIVILKKMGIALAWPLVLVARMY